MADVHFGVRALRTLLGDWREQRGTRPAYLALADRIRLLSIDGRIPTDSRLPAERELSTRLGVSRTTVAAAYRELRESGYLVSVRGSGSVTRLPGAAVHAVPSLAPDFLDFTKAALPAVPELAEAYGRAADRMAEHFDAGSYDTVGLPILRRAIADRYTQRGLRTEPGQIMVTIGAQHAIALVARTLLARGDRALIEAPTYPHAYEALRLAGARLVPVNVDGADGWDGEGLLAALRGTSPSLAYLMPDFHNPTGRSMAPELRERAIAAAARQGTLIIADETTAELDIDRRMTPLPFAAYGPEGTVLSIGSVGKTLWGGIRIGWIRADRSVIRKLVAARSAGDLGSPVLEQLLVADMLGRMDGVLELRRAQLRAGRDHLEEALSRAIPEWSVPRVSGGLSTWVGLGRPASSQLALAARTSGLLITAGPRFGIDGAFERFLRIPIGYSPETTDRAVEALAAAWAQVARHPAAEVGYLADVV
ncbi:aminotransferase class I/II-fold pyridoxal phosphate-dependent enzyme [Rathayibacter sp. VKM Ac-2803]|uniref:MocR-like transcription factor YczR n=1 Tax=Rathayibacter sp. VKM Ac-2803 TaxID=2609256 RepID=UPI00135A6517|nr:PLP-dependent aminotransferase family protein [Rathayibacter sp. VKM Ac-2803]MWV51060.1 aminotransferase class I/II-fold pyridoxal phosphate-dependent enzyme [Rathayibacter sp. VKM Ac-2803]